MHRLFQRSIFTVGLTGGIASGKSSIASDLKALGAFAVDADKLGHEAYRRGSATHAAIVREFGAGVVDAQSGEIDRGKLGQIVFGDAARMRALTDIVWPAIGVLLRQSLDGAERSGAAIAVVEAAVLLEAGWQTHVDEVWVAWVPREVAVQRVMQRNGVSRASAEARLAAQWSNEQRLRFAAVEINTDRPRADTQELVRMHYLALQRRAKQRSDK
jgi:dephospho-CoA kinase